MTTFATLKTGEKLSETQYYIVKKIVGNKVQLENENKENIVVDSAYVEKCITSASQFDKTVNLNKTEAAQLLIASANTAMTVNFNKKVDKKTVIDETMKEVEGSSIADIKKAITKAITKTIEGEERTMVGRHTGTVNELGRLNFTDMEITSGHNMRQVDPREINWMVIKGTKYVVK